MLKDILVHIPTECDSQPNVDATISLASTFDAHVDAIATSYVVHSTPYVIPPVAEILEIERRRAAERSETALALFETAARRNRISYDCRSIVDLPARVSSAFGEAARVYDLTIVPQPDPTVHAFDDAVAMQALLQGGGPVLYIPTAWVGALMPKRVGVCWDGSLRAARALRDARAFLSRADVVVMIAVNDGMRPSNEATARELAHHMVRAGLVAELAELTTGQSDVWSLILSAAVDENLDMLVMGAYGHSRLQEGGGGVTQAVLRAMPVPTLMSH